MILDVIKDIVSKIFNECGYENEVKISKSNRPDLCDYQCDDVFKLAKIYHKNPSLIGNEIVNKINDYSDFSKYFEKVEFVMPGFINITISDSLINTILNDMIKNPNFNIKSDIKEKFILDYGGANIAKPLHVGHLRSAIIGESIKRIINFKGHTTISDTHLGDYGLQIGEVIYGIKKDNIPLESLTLDYLERIYPEMSKLCKEDEDVLNECANITKALQEGNEEYGKMWEKICEISINDIKRLYEYLDVSFDLWNGESNSYKYIEPLTNLLNEKKLLKESEGALIIDVKQESDNKEIPPLIYIKSNGGYLYGTTDLATIYQRIKEYEPNNIIYVTDFRQSLHFEQVFRASKLCNLTTNINLKHLGYGTINDSTGKPFKTRNGDAAKLDDLFKQVKDAFISTRDSNKDLSEHDLNIIVNSIIKFADLQNNYEKDYVFDIDKFSKVVGKTGPYILYTYLRMNKIIKEENINIDLLNDKIYNEYDRNLRLKLVDLPLVIESTFVELRPNYIAEYVYDICGLDNVFYQNNHIIGCEDEIKQQWLLLLDFTNKIIKKLLNLLVIDIPSQM